MVRSGVKLYDPGYQMRDWSVKIEESVKNVGVLKKL